jgi:hypothetical protein
VFYAYIVVFFSRGFGHGVAINGTEMAVARSSDGGRTWRSTFFALQPGQTKFNDKPYIAVDDNPSSPHRDTIYVAWDRSDGSSSSFNGVLVSHSADGGQTFSAPVFAGNSFGPTHTIAPTEVAFDVAIPAMATRRALVYPACAADTSTGPRRGMLYCSWMDQTPSNGTDIFVSRSTGNGGTWSPPLRVNNDPTGVANDQFNQWLAVDPSDGSVNLSWNDTRNDPAHLSTDIFYARSTDGGLSFAKNVQVTTAPTNETCCGADLGNQYGDYEGIAAMDGSIHPIWTDRRAAVASLDEEIFTTTITVR